MRNPDGSLCVEFDHSVYRLNAIKKAAYKYGGLFHVLVRDKATTAQVCLTPKDGCTDNPESVARDFCNEVLDQELREAIAIETSGIRNLLLAHAFSKTSLIDSELETESYDNEGQK
jgi:His-Xaa-Ser system protein HxsD